VDVQAGQIIVLRLFDVAYEIDLKQAESLWSQRSQGASMRSRLVGTPAKAVSFGVPPLKLDLGPVTLQLADQEVSAFASVRLYDFGIAALALRLPVLSVGWDQFSRLANDACQAIGLTSTSLIWDGLLERLQSSIAESWVRPTAVPIQEDYLIAVVEAFDKPVTAQALLEQLDLVPLLSGRDRPLSERSRRDLLGHHFSYFTDDLAVVTWDRAFLYEPQRETDVADVLEIANAQLLEMRVYDEMLDAELPKMRAMIETARRRTDLFASRRYARLARRLHGVVAEVSELTERVDNALQVTEDVYLARVYAAAMDLFRVPNVTAAVDRKLSIVRDTYMALHSEAAGSRAELMEMAVLLLILLEVILSLVRH
jgi:hypothetical protein